MRLGDLDKLVQLLMDATLPSADEDTILDLIDRVQVIDAVPVVRCHDCKRWDDDPDSYGKDDGPKGRCMKSFEETLYDDFCSYGKRKEEQDG